MRLAPDRILPNFKRPDTRRRAISLTLALLIEALLFLAIIWQMVGSPTARRIDSTPTTFSLFPADKESNASPKPQAKPKQEQEKAPVKAKPPTLPVVPKAPFKLPGVVELNKDEFAASDISKLPSHKGSAGDSDTGADSPTAYGPGQGPGGKQLFKAEWYREPTDGEMAPYMPANVPRGSWAIIACQTVERYHVENCQGLGESPLGSGLMTALRKASWQFLVRPPRVGGKSMVGAWVSIRFDFSKDKQP